MPVRAVDIVLFDRAASSTSNHVIQATFHAESVERVTLAPIREGLAPSLLPPAIPLPDQRPPAEPWPASDFSPGANEPPKSLSDHRPKIETQLFGVRGRGNRFVYVFDRSASMEGRPLTAAKRELLASLQGLQAANQFQVIFYNHEPQVMPTFRGSLQPMAPADEPGKRLAANFIGGIFADGPTDHMAALTIALQMRPDVIFFLTDAEEPRLKADDFLRIRQLNRGTTIHAIEFGVGPPQSQANFLHHLAMENGGEHTYIDVTLLPATLR